MTSAFGVDHGLVSKAKPGWEQSTAYKNNVKRSEHRTKQAAAVTGAGVGVGVAHGARKAYRESIYSAKRKSMMADAYRKTAGEYRSEAEKLASGKTGVKNRNHAISQARGLGEHYDKSVKGAAEWNAGAIKSLKNANRAKTVGIGAAGAAAGLVGTAQYQSHQKKNVRRKQLARDKVKKSAFGIES
jgi:hypothetical protein